MKQLTFTEKEARKLHILKEVIEGKTSQRDGAYALGISSRQMRRLQNDHKTYGDSCVIHGLKGKHSNFERQDHAIIKEIVSEKRFAGFGPTLLCEHIDKDFGIKTSVETVRKVMIDAKKWVAKTKRFSIYRQERERKAVFGMMIQFDGSYHKWFEDRDEECCLLLAVDDATKKIVHAMFCENEGFECISRFWIQYIIKFGIPDSIYLDKFATYKVNHPKAVYDSKMITNFHRIMGSLGCKLIFANTPQAKGRVERCNRSLQDRLVKEMRLLGISDIVCGNIYLQQTFIELYNEKFSIEAFESGDFHGKNRHSREELDMLFSKVETRTLASDYIISYKSRFFQLLQGDYVIYPKKEIEVFETYDNKLYFKSGTKFVNYLEANAQSTRLQRIKHQGEIQRVKKEKQKIDSEIRAKARHEASKQR